MKNWYCPVCCKTVRGPNRPSKEDLRRYCLPCSTECGVLVFRVPKVKKELTYTHCDVTPDNERFVVDGVDLRTLLDDMCQLDTWEGYFTEFGLPDFKIRRTKMRDYTTGLAIPCKHKFCITIGTGPALNIAEAYMMHEIAHLVDPCAKPHGPSWKKLYCDAVNERYDLSLAWEGLSSYALTDLVEEKIAPIINNSPLD